MRFHLHRDRDWLRHGIYYYEECRCGARRTTRVSWRVDGPSALGWPYAANRHNVETRSSGWVHPPPPGWSRPKAALLDPDHASRPPAGGGPAGRRVPPPPNPGYSLERPMWPAKPRTPPAGPSGVSPSPDGRR